MANPSSAGFRHDITGLRAIAVLAVVVFHINPTILPGGFVGVDIFFVISGFLITGIIWRDLAAGEFSLSSFYARRINRLYPALLTMVLVCAMLTYLVSLPEETIDFGKSLLATLFYVSNLFFYTQSDYFASDLELSPLLHTWSLSVEEQVYLLLPVCLLLIYRSNARLVIPFLLALTVVSFVISEWMIGFDPDLAFYASPTRFFQFFMGGLVALSVTIKPTSRSMAEFACVAGIAGLIYSIAVLSGESRFPGINALYPTIATVLVIYGGQYPGLLSSRVLANPLFIFFGTISYSLYLWHWPVVVFYKAQMGTTPDMSAQIILMIVCTTLGYLSWRFIENILRASNEGCRPLRVLGMAGVSTLGIAFIAALFVSSEGFPKRFSEEQAAWSGYIDYYPERNRRGTCFMSDDNTVLNRKTCIKVTSDKHNLLLIGDSHAAHFYSAMHDSLPDINVSQVTASGCRPLVTATGLPRCTRVMQWAFNDLIDTGDFDTIVLSAQWQASEFASLKATMEQLAPFTENVVVLGPTITYDLALPRLLARSYRNGQEGKLLADARNYDDIKQLEEHMLRSLKPALDSTGARFVSVLDAVCPNSACDVLTDKNVPIQWDYGHYTHEGAMQVMAKLAPAVVPHVATELVLFERD